MTPNPKPGYAAGNILNLLVQLGADLTGYDFSGLSVWQAYVQGVELRDVNIAGADISGVRFTDTFGRIRSLACSPDGSLLAAATSDGNIRIWQTTDFTPVRTLKGQAGWVRSVAFSPDGQLLVGGGPDMTIWLWDVTSGTVVNRLVSTSGRVYSIAFRPDGGLLASVSFVQPGRM